MNEERKMNKKSDTTQISHILLELQSCGIVAFRQDTFETIAFNKAALEMYDMPTIDNLTDVRSEVLKRSILHIKDQTPEELLERLDHISETKEAITYEISVPHADGTIWYLHAEAKAIDLADGITIVIHALTNITERKLLEQKLRYLSEIDSLTQLKNRGYGEQMIIEALKHQKDGMFCLLDIDNFKQINDQYGHAIGDQVLKDVATTLTNVFNEQDIIMRLGGDEFALFTSLHTAGKSAELIVDKFYEEIKKLQMSNDDLPSVTISMGIVFSDNTTHDFDTLYRNADTAMYQAKRAGKGTYNYYKKI